MPWAAQLVSCEHCCAACLSILLRTCLPPGPSAVHERSLAQLAYPCLWHRNVLLSTEGRAKLADAGLAVVMQQQTHRSAETLRGTLVLLLRHLLTARVAAGHG